MGSNHKQVWVKVNAPVDEGVADLVEALNMFPALMTTESSQGDEQSPAWVYFSFGREHWQELAEFTLGHLGPCLSDKLGDQVRVSICVTNSGVPQGELLVRPGAVSDTVDALRALARSGRSSSMSPSSNGMAAPATSTIDMVDPPIPAS